MDKETIIASLKNDLGKLERHIENLRKDLRLVTEELQVTEMSYEMYKKEKERDYETLKATFIELLDTYYLYVFRADDISKSDIKLATYEWMEKSGLL